MITKKQGVERLGQVPLFDGLSKRELGHIWDSMKIVTYKPGHEIVVEGRSGLGFHLILSGEVRVAASSGPSMKLGPNDCFGEMALIDDGPRSASVIAIVPTETAVIVSSTFKTIAKRNPDMLWKLLVEMTGRLRQQQSAKANLTS
jgi:CRP/FNR family cyclic AMP-dependent transcriptional regulator